MTTTVRFSANSTWQSAATGPIRVTLNPEIRFTHIYIGTTPPDDSTTNVFTLKPVAGENYLDVELETGDSLYLRSLQDDAVVSFISTPLTVA